MYQLTEGVAVTGMNRLRVGLTILTAIVLTLVGPANLAAQSSSAANEGVPYSLPVVLPPAKSSPTEDPAAPYSPVVLSLISQLEPHNPPTAEELANASRLLSTHEGSNTTCHSLANVAAKTVTTPRIMPLCFSDGLGLNIMSGPNAGRTTGLPSMVMLASSFDRQLANAMGQVEGREGRNLMVTGLLGPQADTDIFINWARGHHTPGEDPYLNGEISAAQINGIQGQGLMAQLKHFTAYNGTIHDRVTDVQDQALHEILLPPYELALRDGGASSVMCSYAEFRVASPYLAKRVDTLTQASPFPGGSTKTWQLNEPHYACENPLTLTYILRNLWGSKAFVGSDYGAAHSSLGFLQGDDREDPSATYLNGSNPEGVGRGIFGEMDFGIDATSSTCADSSGKKVACTERGAVHVAGIPGPDCPSTGCGIANAVANGTVPLSVFNQALARVLYQEERFGLLGCDNSVAGCKNPGGVGADRSGNAPLPEGSMSGVPEVGTMNGDAAITEKVAEEGAVLLKNDDHALPITNADLRGGIAVSGGGAEYLIANPNNEGAMGFADRNAISPLQQLQALSGKSSSFIFTPAGSPTGKPVPCAVLASSPSSGPAPAGAAGLACSAGSGLQRSSGPLAGALANDRIDPEVNYTTASAQGQLAGGKAYRWDGWIYVPSTDTYVFRIQHSGNEPDAKVGFTLDNSKKTLVDAVSFYQGQYYGTMSVAVSPTNAGYTEKGLRNLQCAIPPPQTPGAAISPAGGGEPVVRCSENPAVGWHKVTITFDTRDMAATAAVSFRFAYSRTKGDIADAAAAAQGKAMALVFVNDQGREVVPSYAPNAKSKVSSLDPTQLQLIEAVAAKNSNTVVVLNTGTPIIVKEWIDNPNVKAVLNLWHAGQEGSTATARLLLGRADPSGHVTITWPKDNTDTLQGYNQPKGLYSGDTAGTHPERLNGATDGSSKETQGIYSGYRYYDQLGLPVQFPFGFGLSYTTFKFSNLKLTPSADGTVAVSFDLSNTGSMAGAAVPQVYVGPGQDVPGIQQAVRSLRGFDRVYLLLGQTKQLTIKLNQRSFQYWSEARQQWVTNYGERTIFVGDADLIANLPLSGPVNLVETKPPR